MTKPAVDIFMSALGSNGKITGEVESQIAIRVADSQIGDNSERQVIHEPNGLVP